MSTRQATVAADQFATAAFWRRLTTTAADSGHEDHSLMLVGHTDPTNRYTLRCSRCDASVIDVVVDRS